MSVKARSNGKGGMASSALLASAVTLLALPSGVLAFSTTFEPHLSPVSGEPVGTLQQGKDSERLASALPMRSLAKGSLFPFTPAGMPNRPDRSVTVAIRVDAQTVRSITVRGIRLRPSADGAAQLRIAPTAFNLGVSRGFHSFSQALVPATDIRRIEMPDLASYKANGTQAPGNSRFAPRIVIDDKPTAGRSPRTFGDDEDQVDVGGSYRLTKNLDVTAGVRYSQDRERLKPLTDGKQDSQAVYVGTQFRF